jgi:hypothetical protein
VSKFFKFLFKNLRKFNLNPGHFFSPSLSLLSPPLLCSGRQRSTATRRGIPAPASRAKARPLTGCHRPPTGPTAGDLPRPISRPCPAHTRHTAVDTRRSSHDAPAMPHPYRGLIPAVSPSIVPRLAPPPLSSPPSRAYRRPPEPLPARAPKLPQLSIATGRPLHI